MMNLFYDSLPDEIQENIYGIRLSDALNKNYHRRVAQKVAIQKIVMSYPIQRIESGAVIYDPYDPVLSRIVDKCSKILTKYDDYKGFWIPYFIRPIERGLIEYQYLNGPNSYIYDKTEYACDRLLEKFEYRKNPIRQHSLS